MTVLVFWLFAATVVTAVCVADCRNRHHTHRRRRYAPVPTSGRRKTL